MRNLKGMPERPKSRTDGATPVVVRDQASIVDVIDRTRADDAADTRLRQARLLRAEWRRERYRRLMAG